MDRPRFPVAAVVSALTAAFAVALFQSRAAAQEPPRVTPPDSPFATLDRGDGLSRIEGAFSYTRGKDVSGAATAIPDQSVRLDLAAQYFFGGGPLGAYGALPVALSAVDGAEDPNGIGNLEFGALLVEPATAHLRLLFRAGFVIPTGDDEGWIATTYGGYGRITDLALSQPRANWLRVSLSPLVETGTLARLKGSIFARADLGFDVPFSESRVDVPVLGRLNGAAGYRRGRYTAALESANVLDLENAGDGKAAIHTAALTAQASFSLAQPGIAFIVPVDKAVREAVAFIAMLTVDVHLPENR